MKIIAFVGMPASGKSEASKVIRNMGLNVINMGDVIREEVKHRQLNPTDSNTGMVANDLRDKEGMDAVARKCIPKIKQKDNDVVVIDGVRGIAEVETFKNEFGNKFSLIAINSPIENRFKRVRKRCRSDDMQKIEDLKIRDEREMKWGMSQAMETADITIENTASLKEFRKQVKDTVERINGQR
ncbi:dephospho-CoA kinase [Methanohalophilus sp.]